MKECRKCLLLKDFIEFSKDYVKKDGLRSLCKSCDAERRKYNYHKNLEREKQTRKQYHLLNREKIQKKNKKYYETHKEQCLAWQKEYLKNSDNYKKSQDHKRHYYERNLEKAKNRTKQWRIDHNSDYKQNLHRRYEINKEIHLKQTRQYKKDNPDKVCAWNARRRAQKLQATPPWLTKDDLKFIRLFYKESNRLTKTTRIKHNVDHIVPLQGENVSGLHVPWNLQVITQKENFQKHNKLIS